MSTMQLNEIFNLYHKFLFLFREKVSHKRSRKALINIFWSFFIKGSGIAISLLMVPMTLTYLTPTKYGIWVTLGSIIGWFGFFDIGLGNGLRNRFTESVASGNHDLAKTYVSTTYAILIILIGVVLLLFYAINPFLDWCSILNTEKDAGMRSELTSLTFFVFTFFCLSFVLRLISTILTADQESAKASSFELLSRVYSLAIVYLLSKSTQGSLLYLGITMSSAQVVVLLFASFYFFSGKYKRYRPSFSSVDFSKTKNLLSIGLSFFVIQFATILLYQTNNVIISHLFGPSEVTPYSISYNYFNTLFMLFSIIIAPFWSAFTEAWVKKDIEWIKKVFKKLISFWLILALLCLVMVVISKWVFKIWIGDDVKVSYMMSSFIGLYVLINSWNGIFSSFLNGVGIIRLQLYLSLFFALLNVPFAYFLGKLIGIEGVLLANILLFVVGSFVYPVQTYRIIQGKASHIWKK